MRNRAKNILPKIMRIGGTPAETINAILTGLNFSYKESKEILYTLNFKNFLDDSWSVICGLARFRDEYGWYKGMFFRNWIAELIRQQT